MLTDLQTLPALSQAPAPLRRIPNFGHMTLFAVITVIALLLAQLLAIGVAMGMHLFPHKSLRDMAQDPKLILPSMFLAYFVAAILCAVIFTAIWKLPFAEGIRWDLAPVARHRWLLVGAGIILSVVVQALSNFLPIPKELPIDQFFRTPLDVWLVAFFGVFIAPAFEELAFRGFVLPALANTWDYFAHRAFRPSATRLEATHFEHGGDALPGTALPGSASPGTALPVGVVVQAGDSASPLAAFAPVHDPQWSLPALVFATTLTSICFALLHADQLAHAWAPLGVLFCVSVVLCVIRLHFRSLAASALVHACYNGTIFVMLFLATGGFRHLERLKQ